MLLPLFIFNSFLCAVLLFALQPMFARMALPLLGGSPAVWNTAMVFYQAALLAGYAYAHATFSRLGVRRQIRWHLAVLALPFFILPIAVPAGWVPPTETNPLPWLLMLLLVGVGLPFFAVATSSPVLQRWFSVTPHPTADDPYFLYAAGNLGSVLALLSYPTLIEPNLTLENQSRLWSVGYGVAFVVTAVCAVMAYRNVRPNRGDGLADTSGSPDDSTVRKTRPPTWRDRALWLALTFVPCSLMLGVTTFITTDLAAIPLLWVIPLTLYLLSFILVFSRRQPIPLIFWRRLLPIAAVPMILVLATGSNEPMTLVMLVSLLAFFVAAMACHGALAANRPPARYLTEFYLCLSLGGFLGGAFNALLAPFLFTSVAEYPLAFTLACLLGLLGADKHRYRAVAATDFVIPAAIGIVTAALFAGARVLAGANDDPETTVLVLLAGIPAFLCYLGSRQPVRFGLSVGAVLLAAHLTAGDPGRLLYAERTFFGVHRVMTDPDERFHRLVHGNTFHGKQSLDPERRREPLAYYHRTGPMGRIFAAYPGFPGDRIAMVGLGTGALAAYGRPEERWDFYEIDPAVVRIARDPRFFTFLDDSAARIDVILGDARLMLKNAPDREYGLIVLDAYTSDAIPVHLLTRESLDLYGRKLAEGGLLAFHISNRHLDLAPLLAELARDAGMDYLFQDDTELTSDERAEGKMPSQWFVLAERAESLDPLRDDLRWRRPEPEDPPRIWTDNYSSLFEVFRWR